MALPSRAVLLLAFSLAACVDTPPLAPTAWRTSSLMDSTGTVRVTFVARDAEGAAPEGKHFPPSLFLRCEDGQSSIYLNLDTDLGRDTVSVHYTLDDRPEQTARWRTSSDRTAVGRWTDSLAVPLIQDLLGHNRLQITTETATGAQTWLFWLDGLTEASAPFREACTI